MNDIKKDDYIKNECSCKHSLIMSKKQTSRLVACALLCAFFIFVAGYFWGKKKALELYNENLQQEVFADQVANLDTILNHDTPQEQPAPVVAQEVTAPQEPEQKKMEPRVAAQDQSVPHYQAHLIGFGMKHPAELYVERLKKKGIATTLVKRISKPAGKNASHKKDIVWYQIVTKPYADKQQLALFVEKIKNSEKLSGIQIVRVDHDGNARKNT